MSATRRAALLMLAAAAGGAAAQPLPGSFDHWRRRFGGVQAAADEAARQRLLDEGEALLRSGDAVAAQDTFQRAAMLMHAPDTECSIVRAQLQAGRYRQALSFAAHAALAHRGFTGGVALYAWMLHAGGQSVVAARLLDEALQRHPGDAALQFAREQLGQPWPQPQAALLEPPVRAAPYSHGTPMGTSACRCAGTATLAPGGELALVPITTLGDARALWLRNGLGRTVPARPRSRHEAEGVAVVELLAPLPPAEVNAAPQPPFAGSPATTVEFGLHPQGEAAWPMLRQGFFGRLDAQGGPSLPAELPAGPRGGPVFDRAGRLAGIGLRSGGGGNALLPVSLWPALTVSSPPAGLAASSGVSPGVDEIYEQALRLSLQVLLAPSG